MKYYLAGPMSGIPHHNYPSFAEARQRLRSMGYEIFCPAEYAENEGYKSDTPVTKEWVQGKMRIFLSTIANECDAVIVLPGWPQSEGAKVEVTVATAVGKPVFAYHRHRPQVLEELENIKIVMRAEVLK